MTTDSVTCLRIDLESFVRFLFPGLYALFGVLFCLHVTDVCFMGPPASACAHFFIMGVCRQPGPRSLVLSRQDLCPVGGTRCFPGGDRAFLVFLVVQTHDHVVFFRGARAWVEIFYFGDI